MTLAQMLEHWNKVGNEWAHSSCPESPEDATKLTGFPIAAYRARQECERLNFKALPEPYVGNPRTCRVILLKYNPGPVDIDQIHGSGKLYSRIQCGSNYLQIFSDWSSLPLATQESWRSGTKGLRSLVNLARESEMNNLLDALWGVDMIPWHSSRTGILDLADEALLAYVRKFVLKPIKEVAAHLEYPFMGTVFAVGKDWERLLRSVLQQEPKTIDQDWAESNEFEAWPKKHDGSYVERTFSLFGASETAPRVLVTHGRGGNMWPQDLFSPMILELLEENRRVGAHG